MNVAVFGPASLVKHGIVSVLENELPGASVAGIEGELASRKESAASKEEVSSKADLVVNVLSGEENVETLVDFFAKGRYSNVPVLFVYRQFPLKLIVNLLRKLDGQIVGVVSSSDEVDTISIALKRLLSGKKFLNLETIDWVFERIIKQNTAQISQDGSNLSDTEFKVAKLLVSGQRITSIARTMNRNPSTISAVKKRIFQKTSTNDIIRLKEVLF